MAVGKKKMYNQPCSPAAMIFPSWYSVIEKLIHFFAGSPYTNAENYEETPTASQTFSTASREIHGNLFQTISSSNL